jgi:uncharacterized protein YecE (DUF72 family)
MSDVEYTEEQIEDWKEEVEESGDPESDVYFHEDEDDE